MMKWLRRLFGPRKAYKFQHKEGPTHVVYARDIQEAERRMRSFLRAKMFSPFAMWYDPYAVDREFGKCRLVDETEEEK